MPFNLDNLNPGVVFYVDETQNEWVKIRVSTGVDLEKIDGQTLEKKIEYRHPVKENGKPDKRKALQRIEYMDFKHPVVKHKQLRQELLWDLTIEDWCILDEKGKKIPCNKENKIKLMEGSVEFSLFVSDCIDTLTEQKLNRDKEQEKNLSTSAKKSQKSQTVTDVEN